MATMTRLILRVGSWISVVAVLLVAVVIGLSTLAPRGLQVTFLQSTWSYAQSRSVQVVYLYDVERGVTLTVRRLPYRGSGFTWAPDGEHMVIYTPVDQAEVSTTVVSVIKFPQDSDANLYTSMMTEGLFPDSTPVWSPQSDLIAVSRIAPNGSAFLHYIDVAAGRLVRGETDIDYTFSAGTLAWSPDGDYLAFQRSLGRRVPGNYIGLIDMRHGGIINPLTDADTPSEMTNNVAPVWSPDGDYLILNNAPIMDVYDEDLRATILDVESGTTQVLHPDLPAMNAAWSPDGRTIAFDTRIWTRQNNGMTGYGGEGIYLASWPELTYRFLPAPCSQPQWSASSTHILCSSNDPQNRQYYLLRVDDGHLSPLKVGTIPAYEIVYATWRP